MAAGEQALGIVFTGATLYVGLLLLGLAVIQALVGIVFFRHWTALVWFLAETLLLFGTAVAIMILPDGTGSFAGWVGGGLFTLIFVFSFRSWRKLRT